jgi:sigma-B regulation protein RsbU (phosphoserine phosphatase)
MLFSDVCGHGMSAAFITAVIKTTFQDWLDKPSTLLHLGTSLNKNLYRLTPIDSFAAIFVASYNYSTGKFQYINFGHNPEPWLIPSDKNRPVRALSDARSLVMGFIEKVEPATSEVTLYPGDSLVFVSDGVVDNCDPDGQLFGTDWFEKILEKNRSFPVGDLIKAIRNETNNCVGTSDQLDDCTVLAFKIKKLRG